MLGVFALLVACAPAENNVIETEEQLPQGIDTTQQVNLEAVLVTVNGEQITQGDLENMKMQIPAEAGLSDEDLLNELVAQKLILQEAKRQNITVSFEDVEAYLAQLGIDSAVFEQMSDAEYLQVLQEQQEQLVLLEFLNQFTEPVTSEQAQTYFEENQEFIIAQVGENVTFTEIEPQIIQLLEQEQLNNAYNQVIQELQETAVIE